MFWIRVRGFAVLSFDVGIPVFGLGVGGLRFLRFEVWGFILGMGCFGFWVFEVRGLGLRVVCWGTGFGGLGFQVLGFEVRCFVLDPKFWWFGVFQVQGFSYGVSGQVSGFALAFRDRGFVVPGFGIGVSGLRLRVRGVGLGFGVCGPRFLVRDGGFGVRVFRGSGFRVRGFVPRAFGFRVSCSGLLVPGFLV